ncbi:stage II sporulation protein R [Oscillibacter sp.]|uniref:stage II sporulation protein R n=1 Tax=Oscillibacter sp. TaxID=1945593 RepID=UPI0026053C4E|nr:stage II sporulation protein R [Oscillibacter sp.]MDD3346898.1 stage II sporulation protein R [Oscillibacter sp.]
MKTATKVSKKLHIVEIVLLIALAVFLTSGALALRTQSQLADKVVRLHVLANSDSEEDQALKLRVRDKILERATDLLERSKDRGEAEGLLRGDLLEMERIAAEEIAAAGYDYPVTAELTDTEFPTKEYDGFTLPAGEYLALRIVIGAGGGHNWWCVVFPPLCTSAAADVPASALAAGLSEEEVGLITEENQGYALKFKTVELWEKLRQNWKD